MRMADGFEVLGFGHVEVLALEPMPESLAPDGAPEFSRLLAVEREQFRHGVNAFFVETLFSARANAGQIAEGESAECFGENVEGKGNEAIRLFHVAGNLGEIAIGGESDGTAEHGADLLLNASFDLAAEFHSGQERSLAAH